MTHIARLRKYLGLTQAEFAKSLNVSRTTVTMWEIEQRQPDYHILKEISTKYAVSADYIIGNGVFQNWDEIINNKDAVFGELCQLIPADYCATGAEKNLIAQLDIAFHWDFDEIWLARWFTYAVKSVSFDTDDGWPEITLTNEFQSAINAYRRAHLDNQPKVYDSKTLMDNFVHRMQSNADEEDMFIKYDPTGVVPVLGRIAAGVPISAIEEVEGYEPVTVSDPENCYYLRVEGDSMIGAGIQSGDLVLIRQQPTADNGQIVACKVNGDEATLKRFRQQSETVLLMPENPNYEPIVVPAKDFDTGHAQIFGVAIEVKRKL